MPEGELDHAGIAVPVAAERLRGLRQAGDVHFREILTGTDILVARFA